MKKLFLTAVLAFCVCSIHAQEDEVILDY